MIGLLVLSGVWTSTAAGYVIGGRAWPGGVITYHNAFPADGPEVQAAVHDWNTSGAHVRFVAAPASRAEVTIEKLPANFFPPITIPGLGRVKNPDVTGFASIGFVPRGGLVFSPSGHHYVGAHVWLVPVGYRFGGAPISKASMTDTAVHELGHVLGLNHELHKCAVMNASFGGVCRAAHPWIGLCANPLQPDDVRGAVALYGGRAPRAGQRLCPIARLPAAVSGLSAHLINASTGTVRVQWRDPAGVTLPQKAFDPLTLLGRASVQDYSLFGHAGACGSQKGTYLDGGGARAGQPQHADVQLAAGNWCLHVQIFDVFNRPGALAAVPVTVAGNGVPGGPSAAFTEDDSIVAGTPATFEDFSQAGTAPIVSWRWSFGDGGSASTQNPQHTYAAAGTYTVTLTVTDANGSSSQQSQAVTVTAPQPPTAAFDAPPEVSAGSDVPFTDESMQGTSPIVSWQWSFGDGTPDSSAEDPDHAFSAGGSYTVTLTVTDQNGLTSSASQTIIVDP